VTVPAVPTADGLWLVDRRASVAALEALEQQCPRLSARDIARASTMAVLADERAQVWRAGRIALRIILEGIIAESVGAARAAQLRRYPFDLTAHGEPSFVFSQSDAGPYLLIGVSSQGRIGVDVEQPRAFAMSHPRQARVIAAARVVASTDGAEPLSLLQAWTRIEAFAKARGPSLARVLTDLGLIGVAADSEDKAASRAVAIASGLQVHDLSLPHGLIASIARLKGLAVPPLTLFQP
jgi:4'-phosphopantetheinyl transferase